MGRLKFLFIVLSFFLTQCTKELGSDVYSDSEAGSVKQTYKGIVINARQVTVKAADKLAENDLGTIGGGVAGGLLGSTVGKGRGSTIGLVLGAVAGALSGAAVQDKLSTQKGMEYVIELNSGRLLTIVQGTKPQLQSGQSVIVMVGNKGRSRVVPTNTY